jgi:chromosome segregation ATPase
VLGSLGDRSEISGPLQNLAMKTSQTEQVIQTPSEELSVKETRNIEQMLVGFMATIQQSLKANNENINSIKEDLSVNNENINTIISDLGATNENINSVKEDLSVNNENINSIRSHLGATNENFNSVKIVVWYNLPYYTWAC